MTGSSVVTIHPCTFCPKMVISLGWASITFEALVWRSLLTQKNVCCLVMPFSSPSIRNLSFIYPQIDGLYPLTI